MKQQLSRELQRFIHNLVTAVSTAALYSSEHQQVARLVDAVMTSFQLALGGKTDLALVIIDNELVVDGIPVPESMQLSKFIRLLTARGIGHVRLVREVSREECTYLIAGLAQRSDDTDLRSSDNIRLGRVEVRFSQGGAGGGTACSTAFLDGEQQENLVKYQEICETIRKHRKLKVAGVVDIVSGFIDAVRNTSFPLLALSPLRSTDEYTFTHSTNICILNLAQAMALGLSGTLLQDIGIAALLHDVGKYFIPDEVLNKPGRLDESEWRLIREHPVKGALYLLDTPGVPHLAVLTAYEHHMKYDQTGYPAVSAGRSQNLCSHLTAVSDVFDALRTKRPYRGALEMATISETMLGMAGTELHPVLTRNFLKILNELEKEQ